MIRVSTRLSRNSRVSMPIWGLLIVLPVMAAWWLLWLIVFVIYQLCIVYARRWHRLRAVR